MRASSSGGQPGAAAVDLYQFLKRERCSLTAGLPKLPPELEAELRRHLNKLHANDLAVSTSDAARIRCKTGLGYMEVYSGPEMTVCIFLLRSGARIPLHDHPGMHVHGRLLFGRMRVTSFDLDPSAQSRPGACWAQLHSDEVLGPQPTTYALSPKEGNIHELEALDHCAFFDVLAPPYDPRQGRDCTYFRREEDEAGRCLLVPVDLWGFYMDTLEYQGPAFPSQAVPSPHKQRSTVD